MAYSTTTLAVLRQRVSERLLSQFWSTAELNAYINEGLRVWNVLTGYQRGIYSVALAGNAASYATSLVNATTIAVQRVELFGNTHLDPLTIQGIGSMIPTWHDTTSNPPSTPSYWLQIGMNNFVVFPIASTTTAFNFYTLDFAPIPANDAAYIQVGEEDITAIIDYIVFVARLKESGSEFQESASLLKNFLLAASKYNGKIQQSALYKRIIGVPYQQQQRPTGQQEVK